MEQQLEAAVNNQDAVSLEKILADDYFDTYEDAKNAIDKKGTLARCKAGLLDGLMFEKEPQVKRDRDGVMASGMAKLKPARVDDVTPFRVMEVRRFWKKKDGIWRLTSQVRRVTGSDEAD